MTRAAALLALFVVSLLPAGAAAGSAPPKASCRGKLSGAVRGEFSCTAVVVTAADGAPVLSIEGLAPIEGIPSYVPGSFVVPTPVAPGTYSLDLLGFGRASVAAEGGTLYTATKTSSQRGEVTVVLRSVASVPSRPGVYEVHGSYRARLLPSGSAKRDDVVIAVEF